MPFLWLASCQETSLFLFVEVKKRDGMSGLTSLLMEYVAMVAFVVTLVFFIILLVCGVIVNMYLYTHGLFRSRRIRRSKAFEDWDEDYFSAYVSGRYDVTGTYVRRGLLFIGVAILLACVITVTFFFPSLH